MHVYVNVYETSVGYGGPEDDGWYFTLGELLECLGPMPRMEAEELAKAIEEGTDYYGRFGYFHKSPIGAKDAKIGPAWGETHTICIVSDEPGEEYFPKERPRYN